MVVRYAEIVRLSAQMQMMYTHAITALITSMKPFTQIGASVIYVVSAMTRKSSVMSVDT